MTSRGIQTRERIAHHEAAHAVADLRQEIGLGAADIVANPARRSLGHTSTESDWRDSDAMAEAHLVSLLAGFAAELHFDPTPEGAHVARQGARGDFDAAREILERRS